MPSNSDESTLAELVAVEKAWIQAHLDLDLAVLEGIMADEYLAVGQGGELLNRKQTIDSCTSGQRHWDVAEGSDYIVHVYDQTAVVIGR